MGKEFGLQGLMANLSRGPLLDQLTTGNDEEITIYAEFFNQI